MATASVDAWRTAVQGQLAQYQSRQGTLAVPSLPRVPTQGRALSQDSVISWLVGLDYPELVHGDVRDYTIIRGGTVRPAVFRNQNVNLGGTQLTNATLIAPGLGVGGAGYRMINANFSAKRRLTINPSFIRSRTGRVRLQGAAAIGRGEGYKTLTGVLTVPGVNTAIIAAQLQANIESAYASASRRLVKIEISHETSGYEPKESFDRFKSRLSRLSRGSGASTGTSAPSATSSPVSMEVSSTSGTGFTVPTGLLQQVSGASAGPVSPDDLALIEADSPPPSPPPPPPRSPSPTPSPPMSPLPPRRPPSPEPVMRSMLPMRSRRRPRPTEISPRPARNTLTLEEELDGIISNPVIAEAVEEREEQIEEAVVTATADSTEYPGVTPLPQVPLSAAARQTILVILQCSIACDLISKQPGGLSSTTRDYWMNRKRSYEELAITTAVTATNGASPLVQYERQMEIYRQALERLQRNRYYDSALRGEFDASTLLLNEALQPYSSGDILAQVDVLRDAGIISDFALSDIGELGDPVISAGSARRRAVELGGTRVSMGVRTREVAQRLIDMKLNPTGVSAFSTDPDSREPPTRKRANISDFESSYNIIKAHARSHNIIDKRVYI